jgi:iron complex transport system ATP-binding protein
MLDFTDVAFDFSDKPFIADLSFAVAKGEVLGLIGPNGAGKSTVLKLAAGLLKPRAGSIRLAGRPIASYSGRERARRVAYLPQQLDARLPFRVAELVEMGGYPHRGRAPRETSEALRLAGLETKADAPLGRLSGGELRRAYLAMTLRQGADCLLLDEPLAGLDLRYQAELLKLLRGIATGTGTTVIMSLHDMGAALWLDRLLALKEGELIGTGKPRELLSEELIRKLFDLDEEAAWIFRPGAGPTERKSTTP